MNNPQMVPGTPPTGDTGSTDQHMQGGTPPGTPGADTVDSVEKAADPQGGAVSNEEGGDKQVV